jgi:hypothetical protein
MAEDRERPVDVARKMGKRWCGKTKMWETIKI